MARKPAPRQRRCRQATKLFVLDTNVLMHDPTSVYRFEEHDVFLPIMTLEELDNHKKGMSEIARNARQVTRTLDEIVSSVDEAIDQGIELFGPFARLASGRLFLQTEAIAGDLPAGLPTAKADNQILAVVIHLQRRPGASGDPRLQGHQHAHQGPRARPAGAGLLQRQGARRHRPAVHRHARTGPTSGTSMRQDIESWKKDGRTLYRLKGPLCAQLLVNQFLFQEGKSPLHAIVRDASGNDGRDRDADRLYASEEQASGESPRATASRTSPSTC
jgi:PhoH-like ATPase